MKLSIFSAVTQCDFVGKLSSFLYQYILGKIFNKFPVFLNYVLATQLKIGHLLSINPEFI